MKNSGFSIVLIACFIALASCQNNQPGQAATGPLKDTAVSKVLCPLTTAQNDIAYFDSLCQQTLGSDPIKAYTIRAVDLVTALGMDTTYTSEYQYIRVYLGYRRSNGMNKDTGFKLYIVPVEGANLANHVGGYDIILDSIGKSVGKNPGIGNNTFVLDLNAPCPNTCATNSLLNP